MSAHEVQDQPQGQELPHAQMGDEMHPLLQMIVDNVKYVAIGAGAVVLVVGGYGIFEYVQKKRLQTANAQLGEVLVSTQGEDRIAALEELVRQAPSSIELSARMELAASLQAQDRYEEALAVWQALEGQVPADMNPTVQLGKANALAESGKAEEALVMLQGYLPQAPESYKGEVQRLIADYAEAVGKTDVALDAYKTMLEADTMPEQTRAFYRFKVSQLEQKKAGAS